MSKRTSKARNLSIQAKVRSLAKRSFVKPDTCEIVHLYDVPVEAVTEVVVGAKAAITMPSLIAELRQKKGATFRIKQAVISDTDFEVNFVDITSQC